MLKMVGDRLEGQSFENMDRIWQSIRREVYAPPGAVVQHLFDSIPKGFKAVIKNRGYRIILNTIIDHSV